jgi:hypothetical protein
MSFEPTLLNDPPVWGSDSLAPDQPHSLALQAQVMREQLLAKMALQIRRSLNPSEILQATVDTYEARSLGGAKVPGMLVQDFTFTL